MLYFIFRCKRVEPISDACVDFSKSYVTGSCTKQIQHLIIQSKAVAKERERDLKNLDLKRKEITSSIMTLKQKLFEKIEKLMSRVTDDLDRLFTIETLEMKKHVLSLREMISQLEEKKTRIETSNSQRSEFGLFIAVQKAFRKHEEMTSSLRRIHDEAHRVNLKFNPSDDLENAFKVLNSMGDIVLNTTEYKVIPNHQKAMKGNKPEEFEIRKHVDDRKALQMGETNIHNQEDQETCWATGLAVLNDGSLLVADYNNKQIKLFGPNQEFLNFIQLSTPPFDIALLDQKEMVCTLPEMRHIQFLTFDGKSDVKTGAEVKLDFDCNGVDVLGGNLVVTSITEKCVKLINLKGDVIWTTTIIDKKHGGRLFEWPWYVKTNIETNQVYVSDRLKNTVTTLNCEGNVVSVRDVTGKGPRGLTLDSVGNMYVCHYMADEVEIVNTENLRERRILLNKTDGIKHPQCLCYDTVKGQLLLSVNNSDNILIFQIK